MKKHIVFSAHTYPKQYQILLPSVTRNRLILQSSQNARETSLQAGCVPQLKPVPFRSDRRLWPIKNGHGPSGKSPDFLLLVNRELLLPSKKV
jgi:hypothetical protein